MSGAFDPLRTLKAYISRFMSRLIGRHLLRVAVVSMLLYLFGPPGALYGQVPTMSAYQGYLTEAEGAPLTEANAYAVLPAVRCC
jgi:hypothetical protein